MTLKGDVLKDEDVVKSICDCDIISSLLPGNIGEIAYKIALKCSIPLVDTSYLDTDPFKFDKEAKKIGIPIVPDAGVAPGLSNLIVGHVVSTLDYVESVKIYVGGLPSKVEPPLYHYVNWSVRDMLEEYIRPVRIVKEGKLTYVNPLDGLETVDVSGFGELEAFYTDGLRTLIKTIKAKDMFEKTLRYKGHANVILALKLLGLLSKEPTMVNNVEVIPFELSLKMFEKVVYKPDLEDVLIMKIEVLGTELEKYTIKNITLIDYFDKRTGLSAMARTTGFTNSAIITLLSREQLENGIIPLEKIGMEPRFYLFIKEKLEEKGIKIKEG